MKTNDQLVAAQLVRQTKWLEVPLGGAVPSSPSHMIHYCRRGDVAAHESGSVPAVST